MIQTNPNSKLDKVLLSTFLIKRLWNGQSNNSLDKENIWWMLVSTYLPLPVRVEKNSKNNLLILLSKFPISLYLVSRSDIWKFRKNLDITLYLGLDTLLRMEISKSEWTDFIYWNIYILSIFIKMINKLINFHGSILESICSA